MPLYIWLSEPPITILLEGNEINTELLGLIADKPETMVVLKTLKGRQFATRAGNIVAIREVSQEEVEEAEAEAQRIREAQARAGGRISQPFMRIPGGRGH